VDLLANVKPPITPSYIKIDTAFRVWAEPSNILYDSHIEALNDWAKIVSKVSDSGVFLAQQELDFYFLWQNETGQDAIVSVGYLFLNGTLTASANPGRIWSPFWGEGTIGNSQASLDVGLSLLEWWNQPPTQPLWQADQRDSVQTVQADAGFALWSPGQTTSKFISGDYHVYYDTLLMSQIASYEDYDGLGGAYFNYEDSIILCPYLRLELMTPPMGTRVG
jgi:hypothetical protein